MILPCIALTVSVAALAFVIHNGRRTRQLQRQTWADISLTQIYDSRTGYLMGRARGRAR